MAAEKDEQNGREPRGLGEHSRGLTGEYAHEQGWGLDEEQRRKLEPSPNDTDGGTDYEYGAQDFGDEPINAERVDGTSSDAVKRAGVRLGIQEQKKNA
jgi:hypothetical protein